MIGHENPDMDGDRKLKGILPQPGNINRFVPVDDETRLPVIATLNEVLGYSRRVKSVEARHGYFLVTRLPAVWLRNPVLSKKVYLTPLMGKV